MGTSRAFRKGGRQASLLRHFPHQPAPGRGRRRGSRLDGLRRSLRCGFAACDLSIGPYADRDHQERGELRSPPNACYFFRIISYPAVSCGFDIQRKTPAAGKPSSVSGSKDKVRPCPPVRAAAACPRSLFRRRLVPHEGGSTNRFMRRRVALLAVVM